MSDSTISERYMSDREFRHLSKSDLLDIIYEYQKQEAEHLAEIEELTQKLSAQEIKIKNAGSIAEAVVGLSDIFETAQKTADKYLQSVYEANIGAEIEAQRIIEEAKQEAALIVRSARMQRDSLQDVSAEGGVKPGMTMAERFSLKTRVNDNDEG